MRLVAVHMMQGRKTTEGRIRRAQQLRSQGYSLREIAQQLGLSKSAVHTYCRKISLPDVPPEQDELDEVDLSERNEGIQTEQKSYADLLMEKHEAIAEAYRVSARLGDRHGMEMARQALESNKRKADAYFLRRMNRARLGLPIKE